MTSRIHVVALAAVLLPSCGGGGSGTTPVTTPPTTLAPCTQTVLFQGGGPIGGGVAAGQDFSVSSTVATRLDVIVDWTSATSLIGVYVFQGACNIDQFNARACNFIIRSEPSTAKPRRVSAANVAQGNYTLVIANFGSLDESVATQIILSSVTCPALASGGIGSSAGPWPPLREIVFR
jgi:hypothetical protein